MESGFFGTSPSFLHLQLTWKQPSIKTWFYINFMTLLGFIHRTFQHKICNFMLGFNRFFHLFCYLQRGEAPGSEGRRYGLQRMKLWASSMNTISCWIAIQLGLQCKSIWFTQQFNLIYFVIQFDLQWKEASFTKVAVTDGKSKRHLLLKEMPSLNLSIYQPIYQRTIDCMS